MLKKNHFIVLSLILMSIIMVGCKEADTNPPVKEDTSLISVKEQGYVVIGFNENLPPYSFLNRNGEVEGFDVDLVQEVMTRMAIKVEARVISSVQAATLQQQNEEIDILNGSHLITENEESFSFSEPYLKSRNVIMVRKNSDILSKNDLTQKKVGIITDSSILKSIENDENLKETMGEIITYETNQKMLTALGIGEVDAVTVDEAFAVFLFIERPSEFRIINEEIESDKLSYALVFRKEDLALKDEINRIISEMKRDGSLENISEKWFKKNIITQ